MIVIACILAVVILAEAVAFLRHIQSLENAWTAERRELVNRIQAPQYIPTGAPMPFTAPDLEPDESHLVGTINLEGE